MSLVATLGDLATGTGNGSIVSVANLNFTINGIPIAVVGDLVQASGIWGTYTGPILTGSLTRTINGRPMAIDGSAWQAGPYSGTILTQNQLFVFA